MTEVAQVLYKTNGDRSKLKNSAYHRKGGSAVSKLGNKPMSDKEIEKKHGEEETFPSTDCLVSYSDFIRYAPDLKVEYVNKMMDKYDIDLQHISRYLFNKGDDGLRSYLRNNKLLNLCNYKKARSKSGLLQFQADIEEWKRREKEAKEIDEAEAQRKRDIIWNAEFIDYKEFKMLPVDGQVAYVNNLIKKYNISLLPIATHLFKVDQGSLREYFKRRNVYDQIEKSKSGNGKTGKARVAVFVDAVRNWRGESVMEETTKSESIGEQPKEDPKSVAHDILASIIGEDEPMDELESIKKPEIPESNISAVYIPIEKETTEEMTESVIQASLEETLAKTPVKVETIEKSDDVSVAESNRHNTVFSANYRSVGMDCDELDALKLMFKNKLVEVCITVRTI